MKKRPTSYLQRLGCVLCIVISGVAVSAGAVPASAIPGGVVPASAGSTAGHGTITNRLATTNRPAAAPADAEGDTPEEVSIDVAAVEKDRVVKLATSALIAEPVTITKYHAKYSPGSVNDFYSNGDFWWPNPATAEGLPYIKRDGQVNPDNFYDHRRCMIQMRDNVAALAAAYKITGNTRYATIAAEWLRVFFVDPTTRMNPNLTYAQAVPGVHKGRGLGIIDSLPLTEVPVAIQVVEKAPGFPSDVSDGVKKWFGDYLEWMTGSTNGEDLAEMNDDHGVMYWLQVASFAKYVGDDDQLAGCRNRFKYFFLPNQMAVDGSFPHELTRAKSYSYSIYQLENMAAIAQLLSTPADDLWQFSSPDGRNLRKAVDYLYPYLQDKTKWPKSTAAETWPPRQPVLLFAGMVFKEQKFIDLWKSEVPEISDDDVGRNSAVTQPIIWIK